MDYISVEKKIQKMHFGANTMNNRENYNPRMKD